MTLESLRQEFPELEHFTERAIRAAINKAMKAASKGVFSTGRPFTEELYKKLILAELNEDHAKSWELICDYCRPQKV